MFDDSVSGGKNEKSDQKKYEREKYDDRNLCSDVHEFVLKIMICIL